MHDTSDGGVTLDGAPRFFGRQGPEPDAEPLRDDAMFYMASVTKPVIFTAGRLLVERGQLNLSDPISRYVPEFTGQGRENATILHLFTLTSPAGGLFSTPHDYAVICAMMLGGGKSGDVRLLSPATVRMMTTNRLNDLPELPEPVRRTQPWGLGWRFESSRHGG